MTGQWYTPPRQLGDTELRQRGVIPQPPGQTGAQEVPQVGRGPVGEQQQGQAPAQVQPKAGQGPAYRPAPNVYRLTPAQRERQEAQQHLPPNLQERFDPPPPLPQPIPHPMDEGLIGKQGYGSRWRSEGDVTRCSWSG